MNIIVVKNIIIVVICVNLVIDVIIIIIVANIIMIIVDIMIIMVIVACCYQFELHDKCDIYTQYRVYQAMGVYFY